MTSKKRFVKYNISEDSKDNILLVIKKRCESEISFLIKKYSLGNDKHVEDMKSEFLCQRWKTVLVASHQNFLVSAVSMGLMERSWCSEYVKLVVLNSFSIQSL